jgi:chromosome segregation ATPase
MTDHPAYCPHGHQWSKCDTCDLIEAEKRITELEEQNARWLDAYNRQVKLKEETEQELTTAQARETKLRDALQQSEKEILEAELKISVRLDELHGLKGLLIACQAREANLRESLEYCESYVDSHSDWCGTIKPFLDDIRKFTSMAKELK